MTVHIHPAAAKNARENARTIIRAKAGTYPDEDVIFAARELQDWGDATDVIQGQLVERSILDLIETRQANNTRRALNNVYPPHWPILIMIGTALVIVLCIALLVAQ